MRFREQRLWDRMSEHVPRTVRLERIENGIGDGLPDVLACYLGIVTWCELKALAEPPVRESTPLLGKKKGLAQGQLNWHFDWAKHGGRSCVIVGVGSREVFLIDGLLIEAINEMTHESFRTHSKARDWATVAAYLMRSKP